MTESVTRLYETTFIVRPDVDAGQVDSLKEEVSELLSNLKAPQVRWESWGRRKLAFPIKKVSKGTYLYVLYLGAADAASELERVLKYNEHVLRSLTVRVLDDVDQGAFDYQEWSSKVTPLADYGDDSDSGGRDEGGDDADGDTVEAEDSAEVKADEDSDDSESAETDATADESGEEDSA